MNERVAAVILAAGRSTRFGGPKILTLVDGLPAIVRTIRAFQMRPELSPVVLVVSADIREAVADILAREPDETKITLVLGGDRRQDSVRAGIEAAGDVDIVVIHDGARPLVTPQLIDSTIDAVRVGADAAVAAVPVSDTLKRFTHGSVETVDRTDLWRSQTPQAFRMASLRSALAEVHRRGLTVTDESTAIELTGGRVMLVPGDERNIKLTTLGDANLVEALAREETGHGGSHIRTGIGYDVHRLVPGRLLVLGGVQIPSDLGLEGHSDADVLLHAISDAILGACAQGDIGRHFPPSDDAYRNISSLILLQRAMEIVSAQGYRVINIDATIIAEAPKIAPFADRMQAKISEALGIESEVVSLKATTNEGLGFAGRREGIAALAVATVQRGG